MDALAPPAAQTRAAPAHSALRASTAAPGGGGLRNAVSLLPFRSAGLLTPAQCRLSHATANNRRFSAIRAGSGAEPNGAGANAESTAQLDARTPHSAADDAAADALCRRQVLGALAIAPALLAPLMAPRMAEAEEAAPEAAAVAAAEAAAGAVAAGSAAGDAPRVTEKVFLDIAVDGAPVGRLVIGVYGEDVPIGAARFAQLAKGVAGVSYRRKEFLRLTDSYLQGGTLRSFSLTGSGVDPTAFVGGTNADAIAQELQQLQ
ncbi:hypothetical protein CLOM_g24344, partial [Closterium sp. NIES-68]